MFEHYAVGAIVAVVWTDAYFEVDEESDDNFDYCVTTYGVILGYHGKFLKLASEVLPNGEGFRAITHIPVANVLKVTKYG